MLIDSHCHLDRLLLGNGQTLDIFISDAMAKNIGYLLCVAINLESYYAMLAAVADHDQVFVSVGVHPNEGGDGEPDTDALIHLASHRKNVAIGETGLDFYHGADQAVMQKVRFEQHIAVAKIVKKPLIIHSRDADKEMIAMMRTYGAADVGGVMHCFTGDWEFAKAALDLGFYISFSGIVTFKNARLVHDVAKRVPDDRLLIETDSPYLAPVPFRGKPNLPTYINYVAAGIADLRNVAVEKVEEMTTNNFFNCFPAARVQAALVPADISNL